jgi:hypothetical protein
MKIAQSFVLAPVNNSVIYDIINVNFWLAYENYRILWYVSSEILIQIVLQQQSSKYALEYSHRSTNSGQYNVNIMKGSRLIIILTS